MTAGSKYVRTFGAFIINTTVYGQKVVMIMTKIVRFGTITFWKAFVKIIKFTAKGQKSLERIGRS